MHVHAKAKGYVAPRIGPVNNEPIRVWEDGLIPVAGEIPMITFPFLNLLTAKDRILSRAGMWMTGVCQRIISEPYLG